MTTVFLISVVWVIGMFIVPGVVGPYDTEYGVITLYSALIWTAFVCWLGMLVL